MARKKKSTATVADVDKVLDEMGIEKGEPHTQWLPGDFTKDAYVKSRNGR